MIFTAVVTRPQGGKSWEQAERCLCGSPLDRSALLSPGSGALVLGDQTWANTGCKACSTPQKVDEKSHGKTAKQPGNFWTLQAMIGLKPFSIMSQQKSCWSRRFYEVTEEADWTTPVEAEKEWAPGFIRSGNRVLVATSRAGKPGKQHR